MKLGEDFEKKHESYLSKSERSENLTIGKMCETAMLFQESFMNKLKKIERKK